MRFNQQWLFSPEAELVINEVTPGLDPLQSVSRLRKRFPQVNPENISQAVTQARLRTLLTERTGLESKGLVLTQPGLEQATHPAVSKYRADWITKTYGQNLHIVDLTCGLGFDAIALAQNGHRVTAFEIDETVADYARHNTRGLAIQVIHGDSTKSEIPEDANLIFADPARRTKSDIRSIDGASQRIFNPDEWSPPWSFLHSFSLPVIAKVAPGIRDEELGDWNAQWISLNGALVETMVSSAGDGGRFAVLLDAQNGNQHFIPGGHSTAVADIGSFLVVPDPALIRARALNAWATPTKGGLVNEHIAWLTTNDGETASNLATQSPSLGKVLRVLDKLPMNTREIKATLGQYPCSGLTIMTRGVDVDVEKFRKSVFKITDRSGPELVLAIYRSEPHNVALLCERISRHNTGNRH